MSKLLPSTCFATLCLLGLVAAVSPLVQTFAIACGLAGGCLASPFLRRSRLLLWMWFIYGVLWHPWFPLLWFPQLLLLCAARRGDIPITGNMRLLGILVLLAILFFIRTDFQWILIGGIASAVALFRRGRWLEWVGSGAVLSATILWLGWFAWHKRLFWFCTFTPSFSKTWFRLSGSNWFGGVVPGEDFAASAQLAGRYGLAALCVYGFLLIILLGCLSALAARHRDPALRSLAAATVALLGIHLLLHLNWLINGRIFTVSMPFIYPPWSSGAEPFAEALCLGIILGGVIFGRPIPQGATPRPGGQEPPQAPCEHGPSGAHRDKGRAAPPFTSIVKENEAQQSEPALQATPDEWPVNTDKQHARNSTFFVMLANAVNPTTNHRARRIWAMQICVIHTQQFCPGCNHLPGPIAWGDHCSLISNGLCFHSVMGLMTKFIKSRSRTQVFSTLRGVGVTPPSWTVDRLS